MLNLIMPEIWKRTTQKEVGETQLYTHVIEIDYLMIWTKAGMTLNEVPSTNTNLFSLEVENRLEYYSSIG